MVKNMHNVPQKLGSLAERLEICRDQDNNPDSAAYKRKIEALVDEEDLISAREILQRYRDEKSQTETQELSLISWQRNQNYDFPLLRGTDQSCSLPSCRRRAKRLACRRLLPAVDASYGFHKSQALSVDLE